MAQIPSTNISLQAIQAEVGHSGTSNISLKDQSANAPGGSTTLLASPYGMGEFANYEAITFNFPVRGNTTGSPSVGIQSDASSEVYSNHGTASNVTARFYIYYSNNQQDIKIAAVPVASGNDYAIDTYYNNSGSATTLSGGAGANSYPPAPSAEIVNIGSGYKCDVTISGATPTPSGNGIRTFTTSKAGFASNFTHSGGGNWSQSGGAATIPVQTTTQEAAEPGPTSYPITLRVDGQLTAQTEPNLNTIISTGDVHPIFKFQFTKSGSTTYNVYIRANLDAEAYTVF